MTHPVSVRGGSDGVEAHYADMLAAARLFGAAAGETAEAAVALHGSHTPHGLAVDSRGDIYVGEVSYTNWPSTHPGQPMPKLLRSLQKLEKVQ